MQASVAKGSEHTQPEDKAAERSELLTVQAGGSEYKTNHGRNL